MIQRELTDTIVIHCSATPATMDIGVDKIREWHVDDNGWDDVGYHYIIRRMNGELETGRDESMVGSHARAVNGTSLGICLVGGSNSNGDWENNFTDSQFVSLKLLILDLIKRYEMPEDFKQIKNIIGHYEVDDKKECPSFNVPDWLEKEGFQNYVA